MDHSNITSLPWDQICKALNEKGFASIPDFLPHSTCDALVRSYDEDGAYRKTVVMERHRFGLGEYRYFNYPLPSILQNIRSEIYPYLVPVANQWMRVLRLDIHYPLDHEEFVSMCHVQGQQKPTPLILKYGRGGYNTLHQDLYGSIFFPIQLVIFLSEYGEDYAGGEFVMTEQVPRAQSKAIVLKPKKGEALLFATSFRPVKGSRGHYRTNLRHGVSEVTEGSRHTLGIIFHDATS